MNDFLKSLNQKVTSCKIPFQHWEISDPLNKETINEIVNINNIIDKFSRIFLNF